MQPCQAAFVHKTAGVFKHLVRLCREARDNVGPENNFRAEPARFRAESDGIFAQVPAFHAFQDQVVTCLKRQVQMGHEAFFVRNQTHEILIHLN